MAAVLLYFYAAFVISGLLLCPGSKAQKSQCPKICSCLGNLVDCSDKHLTGVPRDIPAWTQILDLQSNQISTIPHNAFSDLVNLRELDISNNHLSTLNASLFENLGSLTEIILNFNSLTKIPHFGGRLVNLTFLSLRHNKITHVNSSALEGLPSLQQLDLNNNQIAELKASSFPGGNSLRVLNLSNNRIARLEVGCFANLTHLETLTLNKNKISSLPKDIFLPMENLKVLELSRNKLREIEGLAFKGLKNLLVLRLKRNGLTILNDGALYGLDSITDLELDNNNITVVRKGWLYGLSTLRQLSLRHNHISSIELNGWDFCSALSMLDMTDNELNGIESSIFAHLMSLESLYLDNNKIANIEDQAFKELESLKTLEMNNNELSSTIEDTTGAFFGLGSLHKLGLGSNKIKSIHKKAFAGLTSLESLDLKGNLLTSIQEHSFSNIPNLKELIINTSNCLCDCKLKWFPNWAKRHGFEESVDVRCSHPQTLKGHSVFTLQETQFTCEDFPKPQIITKPEHTMAPKGANVTLTCTAESSSDSTMEISWKKNNKDVTVEDADILTYANTPNGEVIQITSTLTLREVGDRAEGRYQCIVTNFFGSTYSQKARVTVYVFPVFTKKPQDKTVKAGNTARLECAASGFPKPEMAWIKDGGIDFPAARERRMKMMPSDDVVFITEVNPADMGLYTCMASNIAGNITANATLTVLEKPSFQEEMKDVQVEMGETGVLKCPANGFPKPKITWTKDEQELDITERHFFTSEYELLVIVDTEYGDAGMYTCEISNTLGTERQSASLEVVPATGGGKSRKKGLDSESTTTGIIIIAVVCCVVGTSLVWVIIIYQTRKQREEFSAANTGRTDNFSSDSESDSLRYGGTVGNANRLPSRIRTAAIFPSDTEHEAQMVPLTSDAQAPAENSGNSMITVPSPPQQRRIPGGHHYTTGRGSLPAYCHNISTSQPHIASTTAPTSPYSGTSLQATVPASSSSEHDHEPVGYPGHESLDNAIVTHPYAREEALAPEILDKTIRELFHQAEPPGCDSGLDLSTDISKQPPSYASLSLQQIPRFPKDYHAEEPSIPIATSASPHLVTSTPPISHHAPSHTYHLPVDTSDSVDNVPSHRVLPHRTIDMYLRGQRIPSQTNRMHQDSPSSV
ncbi:leucine-rich repeats and immunoglobulin-like domains protein 2 isoform X2 [Ptychodera flava]|uniref:leucine-rich repeats and immunoglobulin-like domains protein 2 isoform X2 n=1 Tax=Ptychodera flava TaxID=63121 RepID=UPI00396A3FC1